MATCPVCQEDFEALSGPYQDGRIMVAVSTIPPTLPDRRFGGSSLYSL
jgi:hypothetical protein